MGMDVLGNTRWKNVKDFDPPKEVFPDGWLMPTDMEAYEPDDETMAYFRNNVWWWRPLCNYIIEVVHRHTSPTGESYATYLKTDWDEWHMNSGAGLSDTDAKILANLLEKDIELGGAHDFAETNHPIQETDHPEGLILKTLQGHEYEVEADPYSFDIDNVLKFAQFCRWSGGFEIC